MAYGLFHLIYVILLENLKFHQRKGLEYTIVYLSSDFCAYPVFLRGNTPHWALGHRSRLMPFQPSAHPIEVGHIGPGAMGTGPAQGEGVGENTKDFGGVGKVRMK